MRLHLTWNKDWRAYVNLALVCAGICFVVWSKWTGARQVTVLDRKFHLLRFSVYRGTPQKALHWLGIKTPVPPWTCSFRIRYRGEIDPEELRHLKAFLIGGNRLSLELPGYSMAPGPPTFTTSYRLTQIPTNRGPFILVFKLPTSGDPVATWNVGNLR